MENLQNIIEKSLLDEIDDTIKSGDNTVKFYPVFDAIDDLTQRNTEDIKNRFKKSKFDEDLLGNKIELGDLLFCHEQFYYSKYGHYAIAVGYNDKDDQTYLNGKLCVVFGYKFENSRDNILKSDKWLKSKKLSNSKELYQRFGVDSKCFIIIKKGSAQMRKLLKEINLKA